MKSSLLRYVMTVVSLFAVVPVTHAQTDTEEVEAVFSARRDAFVSGDAKALLESYHPSYIQELGMKREMFAGILEQRIASADVQSITTDIVEVISDSEPWVVKVIHRVVHGDDPEIEEQNAIYALKRHEDALRIVMEVEALDPETVNPELGSFVSPVGGFAVQYPSDWFATQPPAMMKGIIIDGVLAMTPDLQASFFVGVVQLPIAMESAVAAKMGAQTDAAALKRMTTDYRIIEEGESSLAGMPGWRIVSEFNLNGTHRKRSQLYYGNESFLYFMICDIDGEVDDDREAKLRNLFAEAIKSFQLVSTDETRSVPQQVVSELGQGSISGNIYTNDDMKCYIAAPEGWSLRTSPNPATLVEMQRDGGKSIIRLIAEKVPDGFDAEQIFSGRIEQVRTIVEDFNEISRAEVTLANGPAWQSVQTYSLEGFGDFGIKEVTLVRNGCYYLILCQAISPDTLEDLEAEFNTTINSFGLLP